MSFSENALQCLDFLLVSQHSSSAATAHSHVTDLSLGGCVAADCVPVACLLSNSSTQIPKQNVIVLQTHPPYSLQPVRY